MRFFRKPLIDQVVWYCAVIAIISIHVCIIASGVPNHRYDTIENIAGMWSFVSSVYCLLYAMTGGFE